MPNFLGVDYGTKRIGLAWSDDLGIAFPIGAICGVLDTNWIFEIEDVIRQKKIDQIIVGYPIHMDGSVGKRANEVDLFISQLEDKFKIFVCRVDERLTSSAVKEVMGKNFVKKKKNDPGQIDANSACLILQDFIENRNVIPSPKTCG